MKVWGKFYERAERWLGDRGRRAAVSLLAGMALTVLVSGVPGTVVSAESPMEERTFQQPVLAWWGTLYPAFCFSEKEEEGPVKMTFWLAKLLDW